jgi:hypothetical protein
VSFPSSELGPPTLPPSKRMEGERGISENVSGPQACVSPPTLVLGGATLAYGDGGPNSDEGTETL